MNLPDVSTMLYAFLGGLLPALLWLWFFLREDKLHPEPRSILITSFIAGMLTVLAVLPVERGAMAYFSGAGLFLAWAAVEEVFKYLAAVLVAFWHKAADEPIDAIIYMITVALGFAAFETGLFLIEPLTAGDITSGILTGNLRFMGAALLHTLSSAALGTLIALSFYKSAYMKIASLFGGLVLATALHTLFNFFIMDSNGEKTSLVFFAVWLGIIILFLMFEKVKRVKRPLRSN